MKTTVTQSDFLDTFRNYDRYDQFGYDALCSLFDYLEELAEDIGQEYELDVISLCCDYSVDSVSDIASNYSIDVAGMDDEEARDEVIGWLDKNTTVVDSDCNGLILYCSSF